MTRTRIAALVCWSLSLAALGQPPEGPPPDLGPRLMGPVEGKVFPPELLMRFQREIGLTDAQRNEIIAEVQKVEAQGVKLQWELASVAEQLAAQLDAPKVDEGKVMAQADKVMNAERDVKRARLAMLVRLKNILTPEQQKKLSELRGGPRERGAPSGGRGRLMIATEPASQVKIDGKVYGATPQIIELEEGAHEIEVHHEATGVRKSHRVQVRAGESVNIRLRLK